MWNCKHCNKIFEFEKTADKANHSRWCDSNPKLSSYTGNPNLKNAVRKSKDIKYGEEKEYIVKCDHCDKDVCVIEREKTFPTKERYFCSRACSNSHVVTNSHRKKTSESMTGKEYVAPYILIKKCEYCMMDFTCNSKRETRFCSRSCSTSFTIKSRNTVARQNRSKLANYRADCAFKFSIKDFPGEFDFELIKTYGWYKPVNRGNNLTGVSRDYMVSIRYGFDNNVDPAIISHPANCRIIKHSDNVSKGINNHISIDTLLERISIWNTKYSVEPKYGHGRDLERTFLESNK